MCSQFTRETNVNDFEGAKENISDAYSCFELAHLKRHVILPPKYIGNIKQGIITVFNAELTLYSERLLAVIMAYNNVRVLQPLASIYGDSSYLHFDIEADFVLFKPLIGSVLYAVANRTSPSHVGCVVHNAFYASIPRPDACDDDDYDDWLGDEIVIGDKFLFEITHIIPTKSISLEGKFTSDRSIEHTLQYTDADGSYMESESMNETVNSSKEFNTECNDITNDISNDISDEDEDDEQSDVSETSKRKIKKKYKREVYEQSDDSDINEDDDERFEKTFNAECNEITNDVSNDISNEYEDRNNVPETSKHKSKKKYRAKVYQKSGDANMDASDDEMLDKMDLHMKIKQEVFSDDDHQSEILTHSKDRVKKSKQDKKMVKSSKHSISESLNRTNVSDYSVNDNIKNEILDGIHTDIKCQNKNKRKSTLKSENEGTTKNMKCKQNLYNVNNIFTGSPQKKSKSKKEVDNFNDRPVKIKTEVVVKQEVIDNENNYEHVNWVITSNKKHKNKKLKNE